VGQDVLERKKYVASTGIRIPDPLARSLVATLAALSLLLAFIIRRLIQNFAVFKVPRLVSLFLLVKVKVGWTQQKAFENKKVKSLNSKMSHPRCVYINNRRRYQSITQQYLKRCLIKDDSNYMFRPIAAIIRFSSENQSYKTLPPYVRMKT